MGAQDNLATTVAALLGMTVSAMLRDPVVASMLHS